MTELDALIMSVGLNLCFIAYSYSLRKRLELVSELFSKLMFVMKGVAEAELTVFRNRDGNIEVQRKKHEDKSSATVV